MVRSTVLIVEDEFITGTDIRNSLKDMGYKAPCIIDNGAEAVERGLAKNASKTRMPVTILGSPSSTRTTRPGTSSP